MKGKHENPLSLSEGKDLDLKQRLNFETLLSELSARFVNLPTDKTDLEITSALEMIGRFLSIDRITIGQFFNNLSRWEITYSWAMPGLKTYIGLPLNEKFPYYYCQAIKGNPIYLSKTPDEWPDNAQEERSWCRQEGIKAFLTLPLIVGGKLLGSLMFMTFKESRLWYPQLIDRHRLISEVFSNVLMRMHSKKELYEALEEIKNLKEKIETDYKYVIEEILIERNHNEILGNSPALNHVLKQVEMVAPTDASVLILGETGTGKDLIARAIHSLSKRAGRPLVKINCATLSPGLIESELFGHEKGAFTSAHAAQVGRFELADGSTLFLDEVGELPVEVQAKLLNVLQYGQFERLGSPKTIKVDARVIAASNKDLEAAIREGTFRKDLWYRLNIFPITLPPLRDRKEDISTLAIAFAYNKGRKMGKKITTIRKEDICRLEKYDWPGNVRELENVIERSVILNKGKILKVDHNSFQSVGIEEDESNHISSMVEMEQKHILKALECSGWRISGPKGAAIILEMNPSTLRARMHRLNIKRPVLK